MRFNPGEIVSVLQTEIEQYRTRTDSRETGRVLEVGDGIARIYGLTGVMAGEMVDFPRAGVKGQAFNLEETSIGVIVLAFVVAAVVVRVGLSSSGGETTASCSWRSAATSSCSRR